MAAHKWIQSIFLFINPGYPATAYIHIQNIHFSLWTENFAYCKSLIIREKNRVINQEEQISNDILTRQLMYSVNFKNSQTFLHIASR